MFYFHPYLGKIPILTNSFQIKWVETTNQVLNGSLFDFLFFSALISTPGGTNIDRSLPREDLWKTAS